MSPSPRTQKKHHPKPLQLPKRCLSIRMYDVGFGDCFLLRIPTPEGKNLKVLFDCGSIKQGVKPFKEIIDQVITDVRDNPTEPPRIDIVVATHRHRDHISGFANPAWGEVEVGEVWMPWTEKPDDTQASRIREIQYRLATQLVNGIQFRLGATIDPAMKGRLKSRLEIAINALSNEGAMRTLYQGFASQPIRRYLPDPTAQTTWFATPRLPGVTVHVLGPSRDPEIIRDLDPPAGQSYLRMAEMRDGSQASQQRPFSEDWVVAKDDYKSVYSELAQSLPESDRDKVRNQSVDLDEVLAVTLDKALNGTSLMLVFQIGETTLLFPGDAQWGTWRLALESPECRKLLSATTYYKVGHHGSHNATPVEFVERVLGDNYWAMVSTHEMSSWPEIPKKELLEKLTLKPGSKIVRSDQPKEAKRLGFSIDKNGVIEASIPFQLEY